MTTRSGEQGVGVDHVINIRQLATWLAGVAMVAGVSAAFVAYAASGTADEAKDTAKEAVVVNASQDMKIQALEIKQEVIREDVADTKQMVRALLRAQNIEDPTRE